MTNTGGTPAGWYHAPGDPEGTQRYWDGAQWIGDPQPVPQQPAPQAPAAPQAPQAPQPTPASDATVAYTPPAAADPAAGQPPQYAAPPAADPAAGQPPQYGAPPAAGQQPPAYGAAPAGQPPAYGTPPPGGGAPPPGYTAYGDPGAVSQAGNLAEGWQRIVARFIDGIIVGFAAFIIGLIIAIALDNVFGGIIAGLFGVAISVAYEVLMTTKADATLGKKIFNMRIVNEDGSRVDEQVMFRRMLPIIVIGLIGAIPIVGLLSIPLNLVFVILSLVWIFTDEKRRSVYDRAGNTNVIVDA